MRWRDTSPTKTGREARSVGAGGVTRSAPQRRTASSDTYMGRPRCRGPQVHILRIGRNRRPTPG
eukprot:CAMPEP_0204265558 /NCGR_PEP_ID=MMETSP0468-20130131/9760_1 /ASSEMBLY_ACC=CAM_ASM_000383 /TAXON_ID=2969 /ORGANISM="Oxyrrhis marina" /LENGTH=63 /DNA_ID=CAMNT_0051240523 /DNA_START=94 /DNA_END=281 /DNA_ORIENTATION=+